jgi:hypothetical protein
MCPSAETGPRQVACPPELSRLAALGEQDPVRWGERFGWLLAQGALLAMPAGAPRPERFAGQFALALSEDPGGSLPQLCRALLPLLGQGAAVAIDLPPTRQAAVALAGRLEHEFACRLAPLALRPMNLSFSVPASHGGGPALLRLLPACRGLGYPAAIARLPDGLFTALARSGRWTDPLGDARPAQPLWNEITALSWTAPAVQLALAGTSRSCCELGQDELPGGVLPDSLFEVPAESAWLTLRLDLAALAAAGPASAWLRRFRRAVRLALRLADNLLEHLPWPSSALRADALASRRVALHLAGVGELVDRLRLPPQQLATLRRVSGWLEAARRSVRDESRRLARLRGPYPALRLAEVAAPFTGRYAGDPGLLLAGRQLFRHRHLLVGSPFALLPAGPSRHPAASYFNLLPALRAADSIGLYDGALRHRLDLADYRRLLRMTWAIARNRE